MNKSQLIDVLSRKTRFTKQDSEILMDALIDTIQKTVAKGEEVKLVGFGTFSVSKRRARQARNPQTGQSIQIPASKVPKFRPGKDFRDRLDKKKAAK